MSSSIAQTGLLTLQDFQSASVRHIPYRSQTQLGCTYESVGTGSALSDLGPGGCLSAAGSVTIRPGRTAMKLAEAKDLILSLMLAGQPEAARSLRVSSASPDGDPAKFLIDGKAARAIHRYNGWLVPISLGWFSGGYDLPVIHKTPFYWYAFAIPERVCTPQITTSSATTSRCANGSWPSPRRSASPTATIHPGDATCGCIRGSGSATSAGAMSRSASTSSPGGSSRSITSRRSPYRLPLASMSVATAQAASQPRTSC